MAAYGPVGECVDIVAFVNGVESNRLAHMNPAKVPVPASYAPMNKSGADFCLCLCGCDTQHQVCPIADDDSLDRVESFGFFCREASQFDVVHFRQVIC